MLLQDELYHAEGLCCIKWERLLSGVRSYTSFCIQLTLFYATINCSSCGYFNNLLPVWYHRLYKALNTAYTYIRSVFVHNQYALHNTTYIIQIQYKHKNFNSNFVCSCALQMLCKVVLLVEKLCIRFTLTYVQMFSVTCLRYSFTSVSCCVVGATLVYSTAHCS